MKNKIIITIKDPSKLHYMKLNDYLLINRSSKTITNLENSSHLKVRFEDLVIARVRVNESNSKTKIIRTRKFIESDLDLIITSTPSYDRVVNNLRKF